MNKQLGPWANALVAVNALAVILLLGGYMHFAAMYDRESIEGDLIDARLARMKWQQQAFRCGMENARLRARLRMGTVTNIFGRD